MRKKVSFMLYRRILIVTAVFPPEPVVSARLSYDIANEFRLRGKEVVVLSPKPSRPLNYNFSKEKMHYPFKHLATDSYVCPQSKMLGRLRESYSFGKATFDYIKRHRNEIDVIYANTWPLFGQFYLVKAAKKFGIECYTHVQDIYPDSYCQKIPRLLGRIVYNTLLPVDKYVLRNSKGVIAISPSMIDYLSESRAVEKSKFTLVRNWQDDKMYIESYKPIEKKGGPIQIMYLGSINPTADVSLIIKAVSKLRNDRFHLCIVGNGPEKDLCQNLVKQLGLNVSFETVSPSCVAKKQSEADVLVLCLRKGVAKTATPSKLTAYMLSGRPIIASVDLDSDCANIIKEAGCGLVVEPGNVEALSKAISDVADQTEADLNKHGKAAFEYALNYLSQESNLEILVNTIIGVNCNDSY